GEKGGTKISIRLSACIGPFARRMLPEELHNGLDRRVLGISHVDDDADVVAIPDLENAGVILGMMQGGTHALGHLIQGAQVLVRVDDQEWRLLARDVLKGRRLPAYFRIGAESRRQAGARANRVDAAYRDGAFDVGQ